MPMGDLLKERTQLFTVVIEGPENGEYYIKMDGVDIYNPVDNTRRDKVAAWFIEDCHHPILSQTGRGYQRCHWTNSRNSGGTESLPFPVGEHACVPSKSSTPAETKSCASIIWGISIKSSRHTPWVYP